MKRVLLTFIYYGFLTGCGSDIELKEDPSLFPEVLASSIDCNNASCLSFKTERYEVNKNTYVPVDMIFILDVSRSMEDNLEKISLAVSSLISYIEHLDWRIVFTTADHGDSQYYCAKGKIENRVSGAGQAQPFCPKEHRIFPKPADSWRTYKGTAPKFGRLMPLQEGTRVLDQNILSSRFPNYTDIFRDTITRNSYEKNSPCQWPPYCQGNHEQPLRVLKSIIERSSAYPAQSFIRKPAVLMVFIMTDERERAADPKNATTAVSVINTFQRAFHSHQNKKIIVYGISITGQSCLEEQDTLEADYSEQLSQLVNLTKGESISICQDSYKSTFVEISKRVQLYVNKIPLEFVPVITQNTPIQVRVFNKNGASIQVEWKKNLNDSSLSFGEILPPGTQVEISYYYNNKTSETKGTHE